MLFFFMKVYSTLKPPCFTCRNSSSFSSFCCVCVHARKGFIKTINHRFSELNVASSENLDKEMASLFFLVKSAWTWRVLSWYHLSLSYTVGKEQQVFQPWSVSQKIVSFRKLKTMHKYRFSLCNLFPLSDRCSAVCCRWNIGLF